MKTTQHFDERRYDIDWIRIGLITSVFIFHIGMFFNGFGWHIKNNDRLLWLDPIMAFLHTWRMPLLFLVSGAGTYFALGKRTMGAFVGERSRKLLIPLVFGMFVIVPPQVFVEKHEQYGSFLNFLPHLAEGSYPVGNLSWHHLWFVLYLFICAVAAIPLILLLRWKRGNFLNALFKRISSLKVSLFLLALPLFGTQVWLLQYFPPETHALVNDWAYISYNFLFFMYGYLLVSNKEFFRNITAHRRIYASIALAFTAAFFFDYFHSIDPYVNNTIQLYLKACGDLSLGLTAVGYASAYLNKDHAWRKPLNDSIYPFYILHQTVIIVIAFFLFRLDMSAGFKAFILLAGTLAVSCSLILVIRQFNLTRILFGMPLKKKAKTVVTRNLTEEPILQKVAGI